MEVKFSRYDTADYLKTEDDIAAYLDAVTEDGDPSLIAAAFGDLVHPATLASLPATWEWAANDWTRPFQAMAN